MAVTRAQVETILVSRTGALLTKAGMDTTTIGSNGDLNDAIGWALRQNDYTVTDISDVTDTDLASVSVANTDKVLDFAELRTLQNISGNWASVDTRVGQRQESFNQFRIAIEERIARKQKQVQADYGLGAVSMETGLITYEFAEHGVEDEEE